MTATHACRDDPRNAHIRICMNGKHKHRSGAAVSVFEPGFILDDGVWGGLRLRDGRPYPPDGDPRHPGHQSRRG